MSWFVKPETVQIDLPEGQWIEVKKRLTHGEERRALASLYTEVRADGRITPNVEMLGKSEVMAYLVEWSLRDDEGKPIRIDTDAKRSAALDLLDPDKFQVISEAITAHVEAMKAQRELDKAAPFIGTGSSATS